MEIPVYELTVNQLLIVATFFVVILIALMFDRYLEKKRENKAIDKVYDDIKVDRE